MLRYVILLLFTNMMTSCYGNLRGEGEVTESTAASGQQPTGNAPSDDFITSANGHLQQQGASWKMLGFNFELPTTASCGVTPAQFDSGIAEMAAHSGANTVRLWFLQSAGGPANWQAFDAALNVLRQRGLRAVVTLGNQWGDCEPLVAGAKNFKTLAWYQTGYQQARDGYNLSFRDYARAVTARYAKDPTVALWQLMNEAQASDANQVCPNETTASQALRAFADDMGEAIHAVDTNHLINLGTRADQDCGLQAADYGMVQAGVMDVCEVHSYAPANEPFSGLLADRVAQCQKMRKPIFMGELGVCRNVDTSGSCTGSNTSQDLQNRAQFIGEKLRANVSGDLDGTLLWQWAPGYSDPVYSFEAGDPVEPMMLSFPNP